MEAGRWWGELTNRAYGIKLRLLTSEQNFCEMALVKNAVRNGTVCYHHDSKKILVLLCLPPESPILVWSDIFRAVCGHLSLPDRLIT